MRNLLREIWSQRSLLLQLWARDYTARYRGGILGLGWSFLNPLLLLAMYSFVFVTVFRMRWPSGPDVQGSFVILLFTGLIVHGFFADLVSRSPFAVTTNVAYVKKVVFPLEFLPLMPLCASLINFAVGLFLVLALVLYLQGFIPLTILYLPLVIAPFILFILGICYFFASVGVYVRDLAQLINFLVSISLFASPVLYPLDSVPPRFQALLYLNPITFAVEELRKLSILGQHPDWIGLSIYSAAALLVFVLGVTWFDKTKKGFADVL